LDNISRAQLISLCKYMGLPTFGTTAFLRFTLDSKIKQLKFDDRSIRKDGVDSLTVEELQSALRARGLAGSSNSKPILKKLMNEWLELSLDHNFPVSVLILSRSFILTSKRSEQTLRNDSAIKDVISSMPEEVLEQIKLQLDEKQGTSTPKQKMEALMSQVELMEEETLEEAEIKQKVQKTVSDLTSSEIEQIKSAISMMSGTSTLEKEKEKFGQIENIFGTT